MGGISRRGKLKIASDSTPSANEPDKYLILVHTVRLKPMSNGISDLEIASVHSRLKKMIMTRKMVPIMGRASS